MFPDIPDKTIAAHDDIDVGDAHIIKQHLYQMNPTKLAAVGQEVEYMLQNDIIEQTRALCMFRFPNTMTVTDFALISGESMQ